MRSALEIRSAAKNRSWKTSLLRHAAMTSWGYSLTETLAFGTRCGPSARQCNRSQYTSDTKNLSQAFKIFGIIHSTVLNFPYRTIDSFGLLKLRFIRHWFHSKCGSGDGCSWRISNVRARFCTTVKFLNCCQDCTRTLGLCWKIMILQ